MFVKNNRPVNQTKSIQPSIKTIGELTNALSKARSDLDKAQVKLQAFNDSETLEHLEIVLISLATRQTNNIILAERTILDTISIALKTETYESEMPILEVIKIVNTSKFTNCISRALKLIKRSERLKSEIEILYRKRQREAKKIYEVHNKAFTEHQIPASQESVVGSKMNISYKKEIELSATTQKVFELHKKIMVLNALLNGEDIVDFVNDPTNYILQIKDLSKKELENEKVKIKQELKLLS